MRRKSISALIFSVAIAVVGLFMPTVVPRGEAQSGCTPFEAIVQANLPSPLPMVSQEDSWGGPIYATLGGEFLAGNISGNEVGSVHGTIGMGKDTVYKACFGQIGDCTHSFTYEAKNAVWPYHPAKWGWATTRPTAQRLCKEQADSRMPQET